MSDMLLQANALTVFPSLDFEPRYLGFIFGEADIETSCSCQILSKPTTIPQSTPTSQRALELLPEAVEGCGDVLLHLELETQARHVLQKHASRAFSLSYVNINIALAECRPYLRIRQRLGSYKEAGAVC